MTSRMTMKTLLLNAEQNHAQLSCTDQTLSAFQFLSFSPAQPINALKLSGDNMCHLLYQSVTKMTNFLDIIHRLISDQKHTTFGVWILSPSSGKMTPTLLGPRDRASPYLRTSSIYWAQQSRCLFT
jgi:hypothetical protein